MLLCISSVPQYHILLSYASPLSGSGFQTAVLPVPSVSYEETGTYLPLAWRYSPWIFPESEYTSHGSLPVRHNSPSLSPQWSAQRTDHTPDPTSYSGSPSSYKYWRNASLFHKPWLWSMHFPYALKLPQRSAAQILHALSCGHSDPLPVDSILPADNILKKDHPTPSWSWKYRVSVQSVHRYPSSHGPFLSASPRS